MVSTPVQFVTTRDGFSIAYAVRGEGVPLVFLPFGVHHLQLVWTGDQRIAPWLERLAARFRLVQYDSRGQGMSTRTLPSDHVMADLELDLDAVVDALELDQFVLLGYFYMAHTAISYATRHPERVKALVLSTASVSMDAWPLDSLVALAARNWEAWLSLWVPPTFTPDERQTLVEYYKQARRLEDWLVSARAFSVSDVTDRLPQIKVPTLVLHPRDFMLLPQEESMRLAASIPGARFSLLDGGLPLGDPDQGIATLSEFLDALTPRVGTAGDSFGLLSAREAEVLRLVAAGRSNAQIAGELVISVNTVGRHLSNIFDKIGATNRVEAAAYARQHGIA